VQTRLSIEEADSCCVIPDMLRHDDMSGIVFADAVHRIGGSIATEPMEIGVSHRLLVVLFGVCGRLGTEPGEETHVDR
jgi:hypothetical protein